MPSHADGPDLMTALIEPVDPGDIASELETLTPLAHFRGLEIHGFAGDECPQTLREVGRLRELGFRAAGAGRNVACDLDDLDRGAGAYRQLITWDPDRREIVALYRYQLGEHGARYGPRVFRTHQLFEYSQRFAGEFLPRAIELGRSVVNPAARRRGLGLFALWTGLRALYDRHPELSCFFGNVTLYRQVPEVARDTIVSFLERLYPPPEPLLLARSALRFEVSRPLVIDDAARQALPNERIRILRDLLRPLGQPVPPILQSYLGLSNSIWFGQTALDQDFGDSLEIGIVVPATALDKSALAERFRRMAH